MVNNDGILIERILKGDNTGFNRNKDFLPWVFKSLSIYIETSTKK